jgi:mevalonate kinase
VSSDRFFSAKLLLFGEHILLRGATAFAVPAPLFRGYWSKEKGPEEALGKLQFQKSIGHLSAELPIDLPRVKADQLEGWYFASNIPQGYGLGSSGAFCAGLLHRYGTKTYLTDTELKADLALLESSFHGKSSGIDPLTSYLNSPLRITHQSVERLPESSAFPQGVTVFLLDTQQPRTTDLLVNWFLANSAESGFAQELEHTLLPVHEQMIASWLESDLERFMEHLAFISEWQWRFLPPMLPSGKSIPFLWQEALATAHTRVKICGAGGGGFVLGFTVNQEWVLERAKELQVPVLFPFETC